MTTDCTTVAENNRIQSVPFANDMIHPCVDVVFSADTLSPHVVTTRRRTERRLATKFANSDQKFAQKRYANRRHMSLAAASSGCELRVAIQQPDVGGNKVVKRLDLDSKDDSGEESEGELVESRPSAGSIPGEEGIVDVQPDGRGTCEWEDTGEDRVDTTLIYDDARRCATGPRCALL